MKAKILVGDVLERIRELPDESVQCVVTSPPYWGLRDYQTAEWEGGDITCDHKQESPRFNGPKQTTHQVSGHASKAESHDRTHCPKCGAERRDQQIGLEKSPEEYVAKIVEVFREVKRVLRKDGTLWLNLGDSYSDAGYSNHANTGGAQRENGGKQHHSTGSGCKPKDLVGIPWIVAFALRADGWWLRQEIIWCLSGGTWIYARTQKGDMPIMVRDLARLRPGTVQLWNGEKWTHLLGMSKSKRRGTELEIVLRSGERISCTPNHKFPTSRGLLKASEIHAGDKLISCRLPEPSNPKLSVIDNDAAWLAGLYVAEGSMSGDTIQIAGHSREISRWIRLCAIAAKYGGSCTQSVSGNNMSIRLYGKVLVAIISELVTGRTAKDKGFAPVVWRHSDSFVGSMLSGYLSGDGAYSQERWRLGFARNYNLERDLRTACARLGYTITLNPSTVKYKGKQVPTFRGEIREARSGHHNEKNRNEVMEVRKARCREVYDLGVEDEPHVFALASGVLTHNSKPNPMPESVDDRCTKAHEQIFLLSKSARYFYDAEAIKELSVTGDLRRPYTSEGAWQLDGRPVEQRHGGEPRKLGQKGEQADETEVRSGKGAAFGRGAGWRDDPNTTPTTRNKRSVWEVPTQPYSEAHFAVFPEALIEPCILAGTSEHGACATCGAPWERILDKTPMVINRSERMHDKGQTRSSGSVVFPGTSFTTGWKATCDCVSEKPVVPCVVLDPFCGSGTTGVVALRFHRDFIGIELNPEFAEMADRRVGGEMPLFANVEQA